MQNLKLSIIQTDIFWEDADKNLINIDKKINDIKEETDLIVLPEMFNTGFSIKNKECAETMNGKTVNWLKSKAKEKKCVITASVFIKENNNFYNRLFWVKPDGNFEYYNKRHLFRLVGEQNIISEGKERKIFKIKNWKILPLICYDLRFPVWSKNRFINNEYEYDLIIYLANWPEPRKYSWKTLLKARAIENQAYVVGVNRVGKDGFGVEHSGDSMIVNYRGRIIKETPPFTEENFNKNLSYSELSDFRKYFTVGLDWDKYNIIQ